MDGSAIVQRRDRLVTRDIGGDTVIVPLAATPEDMKSIFVLNPVGAFVWSQLDRRRRLDELLPLVLEEFDGTSPDEVARDLRAFVEELVTLRLVSVEPAEGSAHTAAGDAPGNADV